MFAIACLDLLHQNKQLVGVHDEYERFCVFKSKGLFMKMFWEWKFCLLRFQKLAGAKINQEGPPYFLNSKILWSHFEFIKTFIGTFTRTFISYLFLRLLPYGMNLQRKCQVCQTFLFLKPEATVNGSYVQRTVWISSHTHPSKTYGI